MTPQKRYIIVMLHTKCQTEIKHKGTNLSSLYFSIFVNLAVLDIMPATRPRLSYHLSPYPSQNPRITIIVSSIVIGALSLAVLGAYVRQRLLQRKVRNAHCRHVWVRHERRYEDGELESHEHLEHLPLEKPLGIYCPFPKECAEIKGHKQFRRCS